MSPGDSSSTVIASGRSSLQSSTTSSMIREEPERERAMPVSSGPQLNPQVEQRHAPSAFKAIHGGTDVPSH